MLIVSGNPVQCFADRQRMRQTLRALELSVSVAGAMSETAREAHRASPQ